MTTPTNEPNVEGVGVPTTGIAARTHYYEAATTWAQDTHANLRASRRTAWVIAGVAVGVATLQAVALAFLLPLKQPVPYTVTVDRETGYVQTTRGVNLGNLSESDAIAQSFLVQYVLAREGFEATDYRENFRKIMLWSQANAEVEYTRFWDKNNPAGANARYRPTTRVQVTVKSVTLLGPRSAMVRFDTEQSEGPNAGGMRQPWVATIGYSFSGKPIAEQDRYLNPLGFQVATYRRDAETTQPVSVAPPPLPPSPTPAPTSLPGQTIVPAAASSTPVAGSSGASTPTNPGLPPTSSTPGASNVAPKSTTGNPNGEEFPNQ